MFGRQLVDEEASLFDHCRVQRTRRQEVKEVSFDGHKIHQTKPLLLLDDVFSELDNDRTERLLHLLVADQTFITTAIQPKIIQQNMYHEVKEGKVLVS